MQAILLGFFQQKKMVPRKNVQHTPYYRSKSSKHSENHVFWGRVRKSTPWFCSFIYTFSRNHPKIVKIILICQDVSIKLVKVPHNMEKTNNRKPTDSPKELQSPKTIPHAEHTFQIRIPIFSLHSDDVVDFSDGIS